MRKTWTTAVAIAAVTLAAAARAQLASPDRDRGDGYAQTEVKPAPDGQATEPRMLVGSEVFAKDQSRIGDVQRVVGNPDGTVLAIHIKTGGFLGFGGKTEAIPQGQFSMRGMYVQLQLTSEEVGQLPEVKDGM